MIFAPFQTSATPNIADLLVFLRGTVGIPDTALPDNSPYLSWALSYAQQYTLDAARMIGGDFYCFAVYLLAASFLLNWAPDNPNSTTPQYFANIRQQLGLTGFKAGVVTSAGDSGTSASVLTPQWLSALTLQQLQALQDPYGRQWLAMMQDFSPVWGIS